MPIPLKTPGVYLTDDDDFPNAIVPVSTAVPAFIGYTQKIHHDGKSLLNHAVKIDSLNAFQAIFGDQAPPALFTITETDLDPDLEFGEQSYTLENTTHRSRLYGAMKLFFANGGNTCYVVSVGEYAEKPEEQALKAGLDVLLKETEPTIIVIPDAAALEDTTIQADDPEYLSKRFRPAYALQSAMINHCGEDTKTRVTILDIPRGYSEPENEPHKSVTAFRDSLKPNHQTSFSYAAAYYPWLQTVVFGSNDVSYKNLSPETLPVLDQILRAEQSDALKTSSELDVMIAYLTERPFQSTQPTKKQWVDLSPDDKQKEKAAACEALRVVSPFYASLLHGILQQLNVMPPSAAMAGIYTMVDITRGVWKAPANVSVGHVAIPTVSIDHDTQENLNAPVDGRSICAIRAFPGMGTLVWGARTLDGNSTEFRYINVRRTLLFMEQSVKQGIQAFVFSPNDGITWQRVSSAISNFLNDLWKQGGLAGATPAEAYSVAVGLGTTMTGEDILDDLMRVSIMVAVSRPAEFVNITFSQKMQSA